MSVQKQQEEVAAALSRTLRVLGELGIPAPKPQQSTVAEVAALKAASHSTGNDREQVIEAIQSLLPQVSLLEEAVQREDKAMLTLDENLESQRQALIKLGRIQVLSVFIRDQSSLLMRVLPNRD